MLTDRDYLDLLRIISKQMNIIHGTISYLLGGVKMDIVQQKIAHLKGLAEGMDIFTSKDGKVYTEMIDIITNLDENVQHIHTRLLDLEEYVDVIDEDLNEIENEFYDVDTEDDFENLLVEDSEDADFEFRDVNFIQIKCPNCDEVVNVDYALFDDSEIKKINCPSCDNQIIINIDIPIEE